MANIQKNIKNLSNNYDEDIQQNLSNIKQENIK